MLRVYQILGQPFYQLPCKLCDIAGNICNDEWGAAAAGVLDAMGVDPAGVPDGAGGVQQALEVHIVLQQPPDAGCPIQRMRRISPPLVQHMRRSFIQHMRRMGRQSARESSSPESLACMLKTKM